jgi:hypothetical protein
MALPVDTALMQRAMRETEKEEGRLVKKRIDQEVRIRRGAITCQQR